MVRANEFVLLSKDKKGDPPFIANVLQFWQEGNNKRMLCKWFYRPEETPVGRKPYHGVMVWKKQQYLNKKAVWFKADQSTIYCSFVLGIAFL